VSSGKEEVMVLHDAKDQFYAELGHKIDSNEIKSEEFVSFISAHAGENPEDNTSGFYELCSNFSDISLNAPKWADPKTCDVQASFQYVDIHKAKKAFKSYIAENGLTDIAGILDVVGQMHRFAVAWNDSRAKSGVVHPEGFNWQPGFFGKYHNFCELPSDIWEKIKCEIIEEMKP